MGPYVCLLPSLGKGAFFKAILESRDSKDDANFMWYTYRNKVRIPHILPRH
jgi:hypothetical protein